MPAFSIPKPIPVSLYSASPSAPNLSLFWDFLNSVNSNLSLSFLWRFPPLFFFGLSSGGSIGLFILGGGAS